MRNFLCRTFAALLWAALLCFRVPALAALTVHFPDIGQGDAAVILCDGESMLIDAGSIRSAATLCDYITGTLNLNHIDCTIATHPHADHIGGLPSVLGTVPVDMILTPVLDWLTQDFAEVQRFAALNGAQLVQAQQGDVITLGGATVTVLHVWPEAWTENDMSIVVRIDYGGTSLLFTGDAEYMAEYMMLDDDVDLHADVLKVGHHGSDTSSTVEFLQAVSPTYAVITCGRDNQYSLPSQTTLDSLNAIGAQIFRTDQDGAIIIMSDGEQVRAGRASDGWYVLNLNTGKFHEPTCPSVQDMLWNNRADLPGTAEEAESMGFVRCKRE